MPVKEICQDCGQTFDGWLYPYAFLCPECRKRHLSESAKKRKLNELGQKARQQKSSKENRDGRKI